MRILFHALIVVVFTQWLLSSMGVHIRGVQRLFIQTAEEAHSLLTVQERMFIWHSKFTPP